MTKHWWVCHAPVLRDGFMARCFDQMAEEDSPSVVARDRDAHIAEAHPDWQPTAAELTLQSYTTHWH